MGDVIALVNCNPGTLLFCPSRSAGATYSYLYVEGLIAFTTEGIVAQGSGIAIEVFPTVVSGSPGGMMRMSNTTGQQIQGQIAFAGNYTVHLTGNRLLLIHSMPGGQFQFFLGPLGGQGMQLQPIPIDKARFAVPQRQPINVKHAHH